MIKDILTPDILKEGRFWTHSKTLINGCTKVSPGCLNCWAERISMNPFFGGKPENRFDGRVQEHPERLPEILPKSSRRAPRVWTYWNDMFHEGVSKNFQKTFFNYLRNAKIDRCSPDYHIICTKRPENAVEFLTKDMSYYLRMIQEQVIILITMENQEMAEIRAPFVVQLSEMGWNMGVLCEPMLSLIDFNLTSLDPIYYDGFNSHLQWVICGPENGTNKRPFDPQWALSLRDQCNKTGVPFYYKANKGVFRIGNNPALELPDI